MNPVGIFGGCITDWILLIIMRSLCSAVPGRVLLEEVDTLGIMASLRSCCCAFGVGNSRQVCYGVHDVELSLLKLQS